MTEFGTLHHIVLRIPDLPGAELYYRELFGLDVLFREGSHEGEYGTVPEGMDWSDAVAAGVDPGMSFLNRGAFSLALMVEDLVGDGRLDHVALAVDPPDRDSIRDRAAGMDCEYEEKSGAVFVTDRYGIEWEITTSTPPPETPFDTLDL